MYSKLYSHPGLAVYTHLTLFYACTHILLSEPFIKQAGINIRTIPNMWEHRESKPWQMTSQVYTKQATYNLFGQLFSKTLFRIWKLSGLSNFGQKLSLITTRHYGYPKTSLDIPLYWPLDLQTSPRLNNICTDPNSRKPSRYM